MELQLTEPDKPLHGNNPPAQAVVFLKGPYADQNGIDDSAYTTPNGTGYGDGVIDNERLGMGHFMYFNNSSNPVNGFPGGASEGGSGDDYYQYLSGQWKNGTRWTYGGAGTSGYVQCNYMSPGTSDPYGYGVGGNPINPIVMPYWDETSSNNSPGDRKGVGSYGPFTFKPYSTQEIDFAYVYGRATSGGNLASVMVMKNRIDSVRQKFNNQITGCGCGNGNTTGINTVVINNKLAIYPNPFTSQTTISFSEEQKNTRIKITDMLGKEISTRTFTGKELIIEKGEMKAGIYFVQIIDANKNVVNKKIILQ